MKTRSSVEAFRYCTDYPISDADGKWHLAAQLLALLGRMITHGYVMKKLVSICICHI